jgi:hypothetical protein
VTPAEAAFFVAFAMAWIIGRVLLRRWMARRLSLGLMTARQVVIVHAASFGLLPLFALPWRHAPLEIVGLAALGFIMFLVSALFGSLAVSHIEGR